MKKNCAILGGGLAGLSCAQELTTGGAEVTVLEREDLVGGLARSYSENGFTYDLGPHRFLIHEPEDVSGFSTLLGEDLLLKQRRSRIFLKGRFFDYPLKVGNAVFSMPPLTTARILADYALARGKTLLRPSPDRSFEDWVASRFGRTLYDIFFKQYTEKAWGIPCTEISADWASQRISLLSLWDTFVKTVFKGSDQPRTYAARFYYPARGGIGALSRAMSDVIEAAGNRVLCEKPVRGLTLDNSRITRVTADNLDIEPDEVIGTLPLTDTIGLLGDKAPEAVCSAADNLRFRAIVFVYLFTKRPRISEDHWIYLPEQRFISNRLTEAVNFSRHNCPEGKTVICAEITCDEGDRTWSTSDDVLAERVVDDLDRLGFLHLTRADVITVRTRRAPHAYPIYDIGYAERVRTILSFFESIENFLPIGRSALFRYNNMDHSIEMGRRAARAILEGTDRDAAAHVATGKQYFG
ncbi:MAG TPA: FAD-dependent oxidoreductase [Myxococcota bacterium]|nr:FAD-dependent oxidoreductase [Myxococcota bacterium]